VGLGAADPEILEGRGSINYTKILELDRTTVPSDVSVWGHYVTSQKVADSISDEVTGSFQFT
jgi:hypothetical protein